jgi:hypothetical protein
VSAILSRIVVGQGTGRTYQRREGIPGPERNHEAEPRKEKDTAVDIERVEEWNRPCFSVDRVQLRGRVQIGEFETHGNRSGLGLPDGEPGRGRQESLVVDASRGSGSGRKVICAVVHDDYQLTTMASSYIQVRAGASVVST